MALKYSTILVSILVLMDLCIKTDFLYYMKCRALCFNPCFNGSMYKNSLQIEVYRLAISFNPCFNGSMYKNVICRGCRFQLICFKLVLMDLCIKTFMTPYIQSIIIICFNPCFNGSMYKNGNKKCLGGLKCVSSFFNGSMFKTYCLRLMK